MPTKKELEKINRSYAERIKELEKRIKEAAEPDEKLLGRIKALEKQNAKLENQQISKEVAVLERSVGRGMWLKTKVIKRVVDEDIFEKRIPVPLDAGDGHIVKVGEEFELAVLQPLSAFKEGEDYRRV